jgi:hypothetical protein
METVHEARRGPKNVNEALAILQLRIDESKIERTKEINHRLATEDLDNLLSDQRLRLQSFIQASRILRECVDTLSIGYAIEEHRLRLIDDLATTIKHVQNVLIRGHIP